jgi:hypothetical protein
MRLRPIESEIPVSKVDNKPERSSSRSDCRLAFLLVLNRQFIIQLTPKITMLLTTEAFSEDVSSRYAVERNPRAGACGRRDEEDWTTIRFLGGILTSLNMDTCPWAILSYKKRLRDIGMRWVVELLSSENSILRKFRGKSSAKTLRVWHIWNPGATFTATWCLVG